MSLDSAPLSCRAAKTDIIQIKDVVNIVAILSGISGVLIGVASIRISNMGAVKEYFQQGDSLENVAARKEIYCKINNNIKIDKNDVAAGSIISFFHFWGIMVKTVSVKWSPVSSRATSMLRQ